MILGNPPYSGHSANKGEWIRNLLRGKDTLTGESTANYFEVDGKPLGERNPKWLNDDYVKFIRFAQWRIEKTGYGILAFISNHSYLDNPTFRGMRQSLITTFDKVYILDLHGNTKKKETCPDGSKDENVFDIQQGVAIGHFVKQDSPANAVSSVEHAHLWGLREVTEGSRADKSPLVGGKYYWLQQNSLDSTDWETIQPQRPFYLFSPQDRRLSEEYERNWKVTEALPIHGVGMTTARDHVVIDFETEPLLARAKLFRDSPESHEELCHQLGIPMKKGWSIARARELIKKENDLNKHLRTVTYRPFDNRIIFYHDSLVWRTVKQIMRHMLRMNNVGLSTTRSIEIGRGWEHLYCTRHMIQHHSVSLKEVNYLFPLYLYPDPDKNDLFDNSEPADTPGGRRPNLAPAFIEDFSKKLRLTFIPDGKGNLGMNDRSTGILPVKNHGQDGHATKTFGPEDVFDYIYAVLHSPTYRSRYADFLKIDFPRIPLTSKKRLFRKLCTLGEELVGLHLMEKHGPNLTAYPVDGNHLVENIRYTEPSNKSPKGRVWINKEQYFEGIPPEVWEFHIGGYQVCNKWLKDRKGRNLTHDDLEHYQHTVAALSETIRLMSEIDKAIEKHGGWPVE